MGLYGQSENKWKIRTIGFIGFSMAAHVGLITALVMQPQVSKNDVSIESVNNTDTALVEIDASAMAPAMAPDTDTGTTAAPVTAADTAPTAGVPAKATKAIKTIKTSLKKTTATISAAPTATVTETPQVAPEVADEATEVSTLSATTSSPESESIPEELSPESTDETSDVPSGVSSDVSSDDVQNTVENSSAASENPTPESDSAAQSETAEADKTAQPANTVVPADSSSDSSPDTSSGEPAETNPGPVDNWTGQGSDDDGKDLAAAGEGDGGIKAAMGVPQGTKIKDAGLRKPLAGNKNAVYPSEDRLAGKQGVSVLVGRVSSDGSIMKVFVEKSAGSKSLDQSAIRAFTKWRFEPGAEEYLRQPFEFKLSGEPQIFNKRRVGQNN